MVETLERKIEKIEEKLGYVFKRKQLCQIAMTHSSYSHEKLTVSNERLEFFGDSILNFIITRQLVLTYPNMDEGQLSKIRSKVVSKEVLAEAIKDLQIEDQLIWGQSQKNSNQKNTEKLLSNFFEAFTAAIYIDSNIQTAKDFVLKFLNKPMKDVVNSGLSSDYKTALQEHTQKHNNTVPEYKFVSKTGPDHSPVFCFNVIVDGEVVGYGCGASKAEAQRKASKNAYEKIIAKEGEKVELKEN